MLKIDLSKRADKFLRKVPAKQGKQIANRILALAENPESIPSVELKGYQPLRRIAAGEYRIIYWIEKDCLNIAIIGKRNDDEVYKLVERFMK